MSSTSVSEIEEELGLIRDSAATFVQRGEIPARVRGLQGSAIGFDRDVWQEIADSGWLGIMARESLGGLELGVRPLAAVLEELGRGPVPEPVAAANVALSTLVRSENEGLRSDLVARVIGGEALPALAWQEEAGDEEGDTLKTTAKAEGGEVALSGTKRFVPSAAGADGFVVSAQAGDEVALFWVPKETDGISIETLPLADGSHWGTLKFDGVRVKGDAEISRGAAAVTALAEARELGRLAASAELFGVMNRAFEMTLEYLRQRRQFDRPIGSFQALQHRAVDLFIQIELSKSALENGLRIFSESEDSVERACAASNAKARCSEAALTVTQKAIQLHGAIGYTEECDLGLFVKRSLALSAWLGNAAYHRRRYAMLAPETNEG